MATSAGGSTANPIKGKIESSRTEETIVSVLLAKREIVLGIIIFMIVVMMPFFNEYFLTFSNLGVLFLSSFHIALMAAGICMLLVMAEIDLSVGSSMALSGTIAAICMKHYGINIPFSIAIGLLATIFVGLVNGLIVVKVGINFLITTLATMGIVRGLVIVLAESGIAFLPRSFNAIGQSRIFGLQTPVWIMFIVLASFGVLLWKNKFFRQMYYVGGNLKAARLVGISTDRVRIMAYVLSGFLSGLAGILSTARFGSAFATAGNGSELNVIAAAVLGGCSLQGGQGNMFGVFLGVMFITLLSNVLVMLNVSTYWHQPINGVVLISAIAFDIGMKKLRVKRERKRALQ
jgi:ribose/xylose/arabinose/galactoside ABC-type transport system permease subunit